MQIECEIVVGDKTLSHQAKQFKTMEQFNTTIICNPRIIDRVYDKDKKVKPDMYGSTRWATLKYCPSPVYKEEKEGCWSIVHIRPQSYGENAGN